MRDGSQPYGCPSQRPERGNPIVSQGQRPWESHTIKRRPVRAVPNTPMRLESTPSCNATRTRGRSHAYPEWMSQKPANGTLKTARSRTDFYGLLAPKLVPGSFYGSLVLKPNPHRIKTGLAPT